ncbi:hypothetical protein NW762_005716 [Fusarium torreyae]|uniref:2EXR domain-containing protein n=1 Tax=Fusarium torreyae TaxID=1237075 RepID=A0A9W8VIV9_9HYPO|nr:hypothetical protein NW762_005716 [Fusarium torreyae]
MPGFPFDKLPKELQLEIINLALPSLIVTCDAPFSHWYPGTIKFKDGRSLLPLKLTCRSIYEAVSKLRYVEAIEQSPRHTQQRVFRFNPKKDILQLRDMDLPQIHPGSKQNLDLPIERLVSVSSRILEPLGEDSNSMRDPAWKSLPFSTQLKLDKLPHLEELYKLLEGGIGGRNYTGGWPLMGFRYFEDKGEIWFTPLAWYEVRDFMRVPIYGDGDNDGDKDDSSLFDPEWMSLRCDAEFVARVWIIRNGEPSPDEAHHRWVKVKEWVEGDPDWVYGIEVMWKVVWLRVEQQRQGKARFQLRL